MTASAAQRVWHPQWPCPVGHIAASLRHGGGDPTYKTDPDGAIWRGLRTPEGTATLRITSRTRDGSVLGEAWGTGADWALTQLPAMLGADDDPSGFVPHHEAVAQAYRLFPHWRVPKSGLVLESLVPAVIDQRTQLGRARISLERDPSLRLGMFARATIDANRSCGISVPRSAVRYRTGGTSVQVVRNDAIETRLVQVGFHSDNDTEIRSGLQEGDMVVANAGSSLRDGDKVTPIVADAARVGQR